MKEGQEHSTGKVEIHLTEDDPAVMEAVIEYLYRDEMPFPSPLAQDIASNNDNGYCLLNVLVAIAADKYDIAPLLFCAERTYKRLLLFLGKPAFDELRRKMYMQVLSSVRAMYNGNLALEGLRSAAKDFFIIHAKEFGNLVKNSEELRKRLNDVIHDCPEFASEVLLVYMTN